MVRRMICKHSEVDAKVRKAIKLYQQKHVKGVFSESEDIESIKPLAAFGTKERRDKKDKSQVFGPVGLLLKSLDENAARISNDNEAIRIIQAGEPDIDISNCPWQFLPREVEELCKRARDQATAGHRKAMANHKEEIDHELYLQALKQHSEEDQRWLRQVANLATWSDAKLATIDDTKGGKCRHCGNEDGSTIHIALHCKCFAKQRFGDDLQLEEVKFEELPAPMQLGIPVVNSLNAAVEGALWPRKNQTLKDKDFDIGTASKAPLKAEAKDLINIIQREAAKDGFSINVRQAIAKCKIPEAVEEPLVLKKCEGCPIEIPNNFPDGS